MFGWEFPPHITGGLGTACYGLTKGLIHRGAEVVFVVPKLYGDEDQREIRLVSASDIKLPRREDIQSDFWEKIQYFEVSSNIIPYLSPQAYTVAKERAAKRSSYKSRVFDEAYKFSGKYGDNLLEEVSRYALMASIIAKNQNCDIIHAHDWLTYTAGVAAKEVINKPLVVHTHATEFDRSGENINQAVYDIERHGMEKADKVISVSNFTRNIVLTKYGIDPAKVVTVHNAADSFMFRDASIYKRNIEDKVVTFLGRVTFQKGPEYFVEAAYKILKKMSNVRFVMAGSGDMLYRMIRRCAELKISDRFHFTGFLEGDEVPRLFATSDVFVMPSVSEPFGIVPLEAMSSNVPVIISKQSGVSEILKHAIKVDFWDIDEMADAIYALIQYPALSEMFIHYGKQEVESLKWEGAAAKVKNVYEQTIEEFKTG